MKAYSATGHLFSNTFAAVGKGNRRFVRQLSRFPLRPSNWPALLLPPCSGLHLERGVVRFLQ